ncbi:hypothetical protein R75471_05520 [Paraburkholderia domus]|uniref:hypothetical protein n=1 Tax=Paraburkholderia domus TaxID=2793075 RepID=UPI001B241AC6|nr:hypothetical protein [Paraburkholderia domus]CAE6944054.1 hypothetical protein R75471_05520 [Paraburkholderia domus]
MTEHEVTFLGRERTRAEHLANVQATIIGAHKLIERARVGEGSESDSSVSCAAFWLKLAADELEALLKHPKD